VRDGQGIGQRNCELEEPLEAHAACRDLVGQRTAFDKLHHEVRMSVLGDAPVHEPRETGVLEIGQDLSFEPEPLLESRVGQPGRHHLEGDSLPELAVCAFRQVHDTHAAAAD
jgi:hypothetical protein